MPRVMINGNTRSQEYITPLKADSSTASRMPQIMATAALVEPSSSAITIPTVEIRKPVDRSMPPPSMINVMPTPRITRYAFWFSMVSRFGKLKKERPATAGPSTRNSAMSTTKTCSIK